MNFLSLIKSRRTVRRYIKKDIPMRLIYKIINAGRWAPSAHNMQPWEFVIVRNKEKISEIAEILSKKSKHLLSGFNVVMRDTSDNINEAPILLLVYSNQIISKKFSRFGKPYDCLGHIYEVQSISNSIENILLCAHSLGLGMAWYGMPLFCEDEINALLKQKNKLYAVLSLGFPSHHLKSVERKNISEIITYV